MWHWVGVGGLLRRPLLLAWAAAGCFLLSLRMFGAPGGSCGASSSALRVVLELCTLGRLSQAPHPRALSQLHAYHCSETHLTLKLHAYTHTHIHTHLCARLEHRIKVRSYPH